MAVVSEIPTLKDCVDDLLHEVAETWTVIGMSRKVTESSVSNVPCAALGSATASSCPADQDETRSVMVSDHESRPTVSGCNSYHDAAAAI